MYIIKIPCTNNRDSYWKAIFQGDPGRTMIREEATTFGEKKRCQKKISELKKLYPNREYILEIR